VTLKKVYCEKAFEYGARAILTFEDENSKQYQLIISVFQPSYPICLEWFDGSNSRFLGCGYINSFVFRKIEDWFLRTLSESLGAELANSIKELIDNKTFNDDLEAIVDILEGDSIHLEYLITEQLNEKINRK